MIKYFSALFCALLVLSLLEPIKCGRFSSRGSSRGSSHSYPSSHGLSGGSRHTSGLSGGHGYPSSSGSRSPSSGGSHGYPASHGLSGSGGSHGYPSSGGSQGYPSSGGLSGGGSGYPSSTGNKHTYPSSTGNKHTYPSSSGGHTYPSSSGGHSYPSSGSGLSGSSHGTVSKPRYPTTHTTHTTVHHHYHYRPPAQITYAAPGQRPVYYPVYRGSPPTYVYQYRDSGSKYGALLTGLALLNLGTLAGSVYANSRSHQTYKAQPGETCRFAVKKSNGDYEETKIDCMLMSSFIYEEEAKSTSGKTGTNTTVVTTSVTNTTIVNTTNTGPAVPVETTTLPPPVMTPLYQMLPNGTLVPVNITVPANTNAPAANAPAANATAANATAANATAPIAGVNGSMPASANGTSTSSMTVTTTTTNTTVVNALDVKGKEIEVTPGMECFLIRTTPSSRMKKHIPCGLLQSYATQSLKRNSAARNLPTFTILFAITAFALY